MSSTALEVRHLETLLALAECGSLSKAAARLFLTQSALSHQLKALESHYGAALVEKNVRPLRFTAIGQRLLALAHAWFYPKWPRQAGMWRAWPKAMRPLASRGPVPQLFRLADARDGCVSETCGPRWSWTLFPASS